MPDAPQPFLGQVLAIDGDRFRIHASISADAILSPSLSQYIENLCQVGLLVHQFELHIRSEHIFSREELVTSASTYSNDSTHASARNDTRNSTQHIASNSHQLRVGSKHIELDKVPYHALAIFDTGCNIGLTGFKGLLHDLVRLDEVLEVEGIENNMVTCTHEGKFRMSFGRELTAYYSPNYPETLVPGVDLDVPREWSFTGRDRHLVINKFTKNGWVSVAQYPRELDPNDIDCSPIFLDSLDSRTKKRASRKRVKWFTHVLYPLPDTAFIWSSPPTTMTTTTSPTVSSRNGKGARAATATKASRKERKLAAYITALTDYHGLRGHRSGEHTVLSYQWEHNITLPQDVIELWLRQHCIDCDLSKITSRSFYKLRRLLPSRAGQHLSIDNIIDMVLSLNNFRYITHL